MSINFFWVAVDFNAFFFFILFWIVVRWHLSCNEKLHSFFFVHTIILLNWKILPLQIGSLAHQGLEKKGQAFKIKVGVMAVSAKNTKKGGSWQIWSWWLRMKRMELSLHSTYWLWRLWIWISGCNTRHLLQQNPWLFPSYKHIILFVYIMPSRISNAWTKLCFWVLWPFF